MEGSNHPGGSLVRWMCSMDQGQMIRWRLRAGHDDHSTLVQATVNTKFYLGITIEKSNIKGINIKYYMLFHSNRCMGPCGLTNHRLLSAQIGLALPTRDWEGFPFRPSHYTPKETAIVNPWFPFFTPPPKSFGLFSPFLPHQTVVRSVSNDLHNLQDL